MTVQVHNMDVLVLQKPLNFLQKDSSTDSYQSVLSSILSGCVREVQCPLTSSLNSRIGQLSLNTLAGSL